MSGEKLDQLLAAVDSSLARWRVEPASVAATAPDALALNEALALCRQALRLGRADAAVALLTCLQRHHPQRGDVALLLGLALRQEQKLIEALPMLERAAELAAAPPQTPTATQVAAQTRFELGLPTAAHLRELLGTQPGNADAVRSCAGALAAEGETPAAISLLRTYLSLHPEWLEGHKLLAKLLWIGGDASGFADSYADACGQRPGHRGLWLAWFRAVAQTRDWPAAKDILDRAERHLIDVPEVRVARLFLACESGDVAETERLLTATEGLVDDTRHLCHIRHCLRTQRYQAAEATAISLLLTPSARIYWPYLALIWRLTGDARAEWLDRPDIAIRSLPVELSAAELQELAAVLRGLHRAKRAYADQSVRGGTQTDRSVLLRHEPILQKARAKLLAAIRVYVAALPPSEQGHPLLGTPRRQLLIEGSWSVRLLAEGHNVPHTHPMGWISTAFYVALPEGSQLGPAPAGHIEFGAPPPELGLKLSPYRRIEPRLGHMAIFPSTLWHSTVPFVGGERLNIAFDLRPPTY